MSIRIFTQAGERYGRLTTIKFARFSSTATPSQAWWLFKCDCGKEKEIKLCHAKSGHTTSCGCFQKEEVSKRFTKHGKHDYPEYKVWAQMLQRCNNLNDAKYSYYGGRGIQVQESWKDFEVFIKDMGRRPGDEYSLERINNNGNYEVSNCKWATDLEQANNRRGWGSVINEKRNLELMNLD